MNVPSSRIRRRQAQEQLCPKRTVTSPKADPIAARRPTATATRPPPGKDTASAAPPATSASAASSVR